MQHNVSVFRLDNISKVLLELVFCVVGLTKITNSKVNTSTQLDSFNLLNSVIPYDM
jgi:hypothetical protein